MSIDLKVWSLLLQVGAGTHESRELELSGSHPPKQYAPTPHFPYSDKREDISDHSCEPWMKILTRAAGKVGRTLLAVATSGIRGSQGRRSHRGQEAECREADHYDNDVVKRILKVDG